MITQAQWAEGVAQVQQSLEVYAGELWRTVYLVWLAAGDEGTGQVEDGLAAVAEALRLVEKHDERIYEAEVYRIKGTLTLQSKVESGEWKVEEAEMCFLKAIEIARQQQVKSLELRAVMSLARLWQHQVQDYATRNTHHDSSPTQHEARTKLDEAHWMLSEVYHWFTEGFDTKDLHEAKGLLEELTG